MHTSAAIQIKVQTAADIGRIAHAVRIAQRIRANEFNLNHQTVQALESGSDTVRIATVFKYLHELGIRINLEMPPGIALEQIDKTRMRIPKATL
jgi:hypothetical protein